MFEKFKKVGLAAATVGFTLAAFGANALTLKLEDNVNGFADVIQSDVDLNGFEGFLGSFGGFSLTVATATNTTFPPLDRLSGTLSSAILDRTQYASGDITLSVSHVFDHTGLTPLPGVGPARLTQTLNTLEGLGTLTSYIKVGPGATEFDMSNPVSTLNSSYNATSDNIFGAFNLNKYSVTHVITISTTTAAEISGSARFIAPIPVPAGGILLLTALGGLGIARRRRKAA